MKKTGKKTAKKAAPKRKSTKQLTESERITVLKDALAQIKAGLYVDSTDIDNPYVSFTGGLDLSTCEVLLGLDSDKIELKKILPRLITKRRPCEVCIKGAVVLSAISKYNNYSLSKINNLNDEASELARRLIGEKNADMMERVYEGWLAPNENKYEAIVSKWVENYPTKKERLIAILKNAIKNKGIFKP